MAIKLYIVVGVGGMIGTCFRYLISLFFQTESVTTFPWATLFVNVTGAFILAFVVFLPSLKKKLTDEVFIALSTGVIGSYTTFSTITIEVVMIWRESNIIAAVYLLVTIVGGLFCSFLGYRAASILERKGM